MLALITTPGAAVLFAMALLLDVALLPHGAGAARALGGPRGGPGYHYSVDLWSARRVDGAVVLLHGDEEGAYTPDTSLFSVSNRRMSRGVWAPTRQEHVVTTTIDRSEFTEAEMTQILGAVAAHFVDPGFHAFDPAAAALMATADMHRSTILWAGWVQNAISGAVLVGLACSLCSAPSWSACFIATRRLRRGLCPRCRYNLAGLIEPRCPECGEELGAPAPPDGEHEAG